MLCSFLEIMTRTKKMNHRGFTVLSIKFNSEEKSHTSPRKKMALLKDSLEYMTGIFLPLAFTTVKKEDRCRFRVLPYTHMLVGSGDKPSCLWLEDQLLPNSMRINSKAIIELGPRSWILWFLESNFPKLNHQESDSKSGHRWHQIAISMD